MSSRSSSSEPPAAATAKTSKKAKKLSKNVPKNEGIDPSWPFTVPPGYTLFDAGSEDEGGEFDWDEIKNNPNLDLWLIRIPNNLQPKHLDSVSLSPSSSCRPEKIGELTRKQATYDIWSCNVSQSSKTSNEPDGRETVIIGEEMNAVTCLLPRKSRKNALYAAPKPISRHIVITAQPPHPQPASKASDAPATVYQNPPRQSYPPELLKHRFMPYGSLAPVANVEPGQEVEKHKHKHKTKSKDTVGAPVVVETNEISGDVGVDVDVALQSSGKRDKKGKKVKIRYGGIDAEGVSKSVDAVPNLPLSEENKKIKKRKGSQELVEAMVEGKKRKKLKTKAE